MSNTTTRPRRPKISSNWLWDEILYEYLIDDADFVFMTNSRHPIIKTKTLYDSTSHLHSEQVDLFYISHTTDGIISYSLDKFDDSWGQQIKDSSKDINEFICDFLQREAAFDLIQYDCLACEGTGSAGHSSYSRTCPHCEGKGIDTHSHLLARALSNHKSSTK